MKPILLLLALTAIFAIGCKGQEKRTPEAEAGADPEKNLIVYASNYPLHYFAGRIGGAHIDLHYPFDPAADPASWMPSADTVTAMQKADLILLNGATYERWLMNVSLPDSLLVDTSIGFAHRLLPSGETFTHSHGDDGAHSHEGVATATWMDLSLAIQQAEAVKNALSARRPQHRAIFENNYNALAADLKNLDTGFRSLRADASLPEPVFSHPVYQYFQKAYGLKGTSLHWEPETPLNHDMLHEIDHLKKEAGIGLMIWERPPLPASAQALALKGIPSAVIQTIAGTPAEGDFLIQMEVNLKTLKSILNTEIP